ncbi:MAG: hypothetical protein NT154_05005 [Verrucomicrobia bacterium]|nr:hypothetical protein [Verrucomicrobiota bacterium]
MNKSEKDNYMDEKILQVRTVVGKYENALAKQHELAGLRDPLECEAKGIILHLSDLPTEVLALPQSGAEHFPTATAQKLRSLASLRTKLELLPGVEAKLVAELARLRPQMRAAVKTLITHCREEAAKDMEKEKSDLTAHLLKCYSGDVESAKVAAVTALNASSAFDLSSAPRQGCSACKWLEAFSHYQHATDPIEDAQTAINMAEAFKKQRAAD